MKHGSRSVTQLHHVRSCLSNRCCTKARCIRTKSAFEGKVVAFSCQIKSLTIILIGWMDVKLWERLETVKCYMHIRNWCKMLYLYPHFRDFEFMSVCACICNVFMNVCIA